MLFVHNYDSLLLMASSTILISQRLADFGFVTWYALAFDIPCRISSFPSLPMNLMVPSIYSNDFNWQVCLYDVIPSLLVAERRRRRKVNEVSGIYKIAFYYVSTI